MCKPGNPDACYVKARLQPTRALGDGYLKASEFNAPPGVPRSHGRHIRPPYTPPYVSSEPEVTVHVLDPVADASSFLLLACDGVWDVLSNEEAVRFVAQDGGDKATVAERLKEHVLSSVAAEQGVDVSYLRGLKLGKNGRRNVHDDITVVVLFVGPSHLTRPEAAMDGQGGGGRKPWW